MEISTVDEHTLERTVNDQVREGWALDGVQFAMRESSKRPSMAFVFFTRLATAEEAARHERSGPAAPRAGARSAHDRLRELAEGGDD